MYGNFNSRIFFSCPSMSMGQPAEPAFKGNNAYIIFKNFYEEKGSIFETHLKGLSLVECYSKEKDNLKSQVLREHGSKFYKDRKFIESLSMFSKSLRYATYNGVEYGLALANRSAALFSLEIYEYCVKDAELCLLADYPKNKKPKILIRLAKCYSYMGQLDKMQEQIQICLKFMKTITDRQLVENYKDNINILIKTYSVHAKYVFEKPDVIPVLEENPSFVNAANSVKFVYNADLGPQVIATQDINRGEVLFVEKAYSVAFRNTSITKLEKQVTKFICKFCAIYLPVSYPCKSCVKVVYCTEKCRDEAWNEYHRWECGLSKTGIPLMDEISLALHTLCKAVHTGINTKQIDYNKEINPYNDKTKAYNYIFNLKMDVVKFKDAAPKEFTTLILDSLFLMFYLKFHTDYFNYMKRLPEYSKMNNKQLECKFGSLILLHSIQNRSKALNLYGLYPGVYPSELLVYETSSSATGFYPSVGQLSHSCLPNTCQYFIGDTVVVKAIKPIQCGAIISRSIFFDSINRIDISDQKGLLNQNLITCNCDMCTGKEFDKRILDSMICIECQGHAKEVYEEYYFFEETCQVPTGVWKCIDCRRQYVLPIQQTVLMKICNSIMNECDFPQHNIRLAQSLINKIKVLKTFYKPFHTHFLRFYKLVLTNGKAEEVMSILQEVKTYFKTRNDAFSYEYGRELIQLCMITYNLMNKDEAISSQNLRKLLNETKLMLVEAKEIMEVFDPHFLYILNELDQLVLEICIKHVIKLAED